MIDAKSVLPGLAVVPATGLPGLAVVPGLAGLPGLMGLTDPRDVFAATYLERRVGLTSEEAAKIVNEHGWWCLYGAQRHRGGGVREAREVREALEDLIPGCSDEVYEKVAVYLDGLRAKRACAMRNEEIKALVDACSAVRGCDRFKINGYAWPLIEEKLLDAGVTIERLLASAKDVMGVFGPDELEELSCVLGPRVNVAGMLEYVASIHSAESVESVETVDAVGPVESKAKDGTEGTRGPEGPGGQEGSGGQAVREEPREETHEDPREETCDEPVPGTPPPVAVQAVMPGKPEDREDREDRVDRGRGGAKKRRLFPNDDASL
jgi:hypothetical protein